MRLLFIGPLAISATGAVAWLYLSLYHLHRSMQQGHRVRLRGDSPLGI